MPTKELNTFIIHLQEVQQKWKESALKNSKAPFFYSSMDTRFLLFSPLKIAITANSEMFTSIENKENETLST